MVMPSVSLIRISPVYDCRAPCSFQVPHDSLWHPVCCLGSLLLREIRGELGEYPDVWSVDSPVGQGPYRVVRLMLS